MKSVTNRLRRTDNIRFLFDSLGQDHFLNGQRIKKAFFVQTLQEKTWQHHVIPAFHFLKNFNKIKNPTTLKASLTFSVYFQRNPLAQKPRLLRPPYALSI